MPNRNEPPCVTVSQVNRVVSMLISADKRLANVSVCGEISNYTKHFKSGHIYFTLKDESSQLSAVMFASSAANLKFEPKSGDKVVCSGQISVYEADGKYQLKCFSMKPDGEGEQSAALEMLMKRLNDEGVFAQKRPIPKKPKCIAVVTSAGAAALQDIITVISRRYPLVKIIVVPALVQGAEAPQSIAAALKRAQNVGADTIIFGRGGGSAEDLSAFNAEVVARAVFESKIPTISAVGHQRDYTIADLAADMRAPTPSAAAELAVPEISSVRLEIDEKLAQVKRMTERVIAEKERALTALYGTVKAQSPRSRLAAQEQRVVAAQKEIRLKIHTRLDKAERSLASTVEMIAALNPLSVLTRGYAAAKADGHIVTDAAQVKQGDEVEILLAKGRLRTQVIESITE
ncbi:MAG: exodeoxyribonuclease VII large subunit [Oscillospiraceae bacterium]